MTITAKVSGRDRPISVAEYAVVVDATPVAIGDSGGGVGSINISGVSVRTGVLEERTSATIDRDVTLSDVEVIEGTSFKGRGSTVGHITEVADVGERVNLSAETILSKLFVTKTADPVFGSRTRGTLSRSVVNNCTNPSLEVSTAGYSTVATGGGTSAVTRSNVTLTAIAGTYHGRVTYSVAATAAGGGVQISVPAVAGQLNFIKWGLAASQAQTVRVTYDWYNGPTFISTTIGLTYVLGATGWADVTEFQMPPTGATTVVVKATSFNSGLAGYTYVNWPASSYLAFDALYVGAEDIPYFDGGFPNASWSGAAGLSASTLTLTTEIDEGYDATLGYAIRYYLALCGLSSDDVVIDPGIDVTRVSLVGWTGVVWNYFKMLCSAYNIEAVVKGSKIYVQRPNKVSLALESGMEFSRVAMKPGNSASIDVVNNNTSYVLNGDVFSATNDISIDSGSSSLVKDTTEHWIKSVNQPVHLTAVPVSPPSSGYYVVYDSAGLVVDPAWWARNGGRVIVTVSNWHDIEILVAAPSATTYTAPFKISAKSSTGLPGLLATGTGVFVEKTSVPLFTGASDDGDAAPTVDNPFIGSRAAAVDRGMHAAQRAGGSAPTISGEISYIPGANGDEFGSIAGMRILYDGAYYRIRSATITPSSIDIHSADSATTFDDLVALFSIVFDEFNVTYAGQTFSDFNTTFTGQTFDQFNGTTPTPTFDDLNAIYVGADFNTHTIYPLLGESPIAASSV